MAKRPRSDRDDADRGQMPSDEADEALLRLARLVGRQIAREQFKGGEFIAPRRRRQKDTA